MNVNYDVSLDIIGKNILGELREFECFKNAFIAGGYTRDALLGGQFKDVDVFVPGLDHDKFSKFIKEIEKTSFITGTNFFMKQRDEYKINRVVNSIIDLQYLESIPVQIINTKYKDDEKFIQRVIKSFNFGIDQAWSKGAEIFTSKEFKEDVKFNRATLFDDQLMVSQLPKHMKKFLRLQEKYPYLMFACPSLQVQYKEKVKEVERLNNSKSYVIGQFSPGIEPVMQWPSNPASEITLNAPSPSSQWTIINEASDIPEYQVLPHTTSPTPQPMHTLDDYEESPNINSVGKSHLNWEPGMWVTTQMLNDAADDTETFSVEQYDELEAAYIAQMNEETESSPS